LVLILCDFNVTKLNGKLKLFISGTDMWQSTM